MEEIFSNLRQYTSELAQRGINISNYTQEPNSSQYLEDFQVGVKLDSYKEIILQEETELELGGISRKSFSLVYPIQNPNFKEFLKNGAITLIGPEIKDISTPSID